MPKIVCNLLASLAALLLLTTTPLAQAQWHKTSSSDDSTSYVSTKPIIYQGPIARTHLLTDLKQPEVLGDPTDPNEKPSKSFVSEVEFECFNRAARITSAKAYSEQMGKGEITVNSEDDTTNPLSAYWHDVQEWAMSKEYAHACKSIPMFAFNHPPERIWLEIEESERRAETPVYEQTVYLDLNSKIRKNDIVKIAQLINLNEALLTNEKTTWMSAVLKLEVECKERAIRDMKISIHPDRMASQKALISAMGTKEWIAVEKDSIKEEIFNIACEN